MNGKKQIVAFVMAVTLSLVVVLLWGKKGEVVVLEDTDSSPQTVPAASDFEKKAHVIELDQATLDQMASGECKRIELALFDGEVVEVELDRGRRQANGKNGAIIYGGVKGEEGSHFYASIVGEAMFAELRLGDGREYKVDFVEEGKFKVVEVNTSVIIDHPGADKGPEYIIVNGKKMPVARCRSTVVAKSDFTQVRMLGSEEWTPGLRILETLNEEEQFVAQVNQSEELVVSRYNGNRPSVRGLKRRTPSQRPKPLINVLTGIGGNTPRNRRLLARLPHGGTTPQSNPRNPNAKPLGILVGLQNQSAIPTQQGTTQQGTTQQGMTNGPTQQQFPIKGFAQTSRPPGWVVNQQQQGTTQQQTTQQQTTQQQTTQQQTTQQQTTQQQTTQQQTTQQQMTQQQQQGTPTTPTSLEFAAATSSVTEGDSGTSAHTVTVNRSGNTSGTATAAYATSNGTASVGTDYTAANGTLTFAAGVTSQTISVTISGDTTVENNETFNITLSNPTQTVGTASITGTNPHVVTITNDDSVPPPPPNTGFGIMVVYTPDVAADLGGANAVQAKAGVWIANLNTCLSNSNLGSITATLAHTYQTTQNFGQNGHSAALTHIGSDATIKGLRDTHKADLVSLMIIGPANGAGTAGLGQVLMSANGNAGTQATAVWHSTSSIVFSHEIGHNHGCGHDIDSANAYLNNGYSHGWHFTGSDSKGYRTVMAYSKSGFPATRVEYFSGTSVMYKGTATGTATANNAKTISETNPKIQQYK